MANRLLVLLALPAVFLAGSSTAHATPILYSIGTCAEGDCAAFEQSGRGEILALLDVVNGNDLLITLTNNLNALAANDDPHLTNIGFEYGGLLSNLTFDSFTVLSGTVHRPTFTVDASIRSFFIDFGFGFSQDTTTSGREGRFQASDPNEVVQIVVGTTGDIDLSFFQLGIAKVAGAGVDGRGDAIVLTGTHTSVPEPGTLALAMVGLVGLALRRSSP